MAGGTRIVAAIAVAGLAVIAAPASGAARIHGQMYCWALDSELPVGCDAEAEDEEGFRDWVFRGPAVREPARRNP